MTAMNFAAHEVIDSKPATSSRAVGTDFARYVAASVGALSVDASIFWLTLVVLKNLAVAVAGGFIVGLVIAYYLSVRWAFEKRCVDDGRIEFIVFAGIGIFGLLITELVLWLLVKQLGFPPLLSKIATSGLVFCFNFALRKALLFTPTARSKAT